MTWVFALVMTTVILKVLDALMGLRVSDEDEATGLDLSQHSETAYILGGSSYGEYSVGGQAAYLTETARAAEAGPRGPESLSGPS